MYSSQGLHCGAKKCGLIWRSTEASVILLMGYVPAYRYAMAMARIVRHAPAHPQIAAAVTNQVV